MVITVTLNPCVDRTLTVDELKRGHLNRTKCSRTDAAGKAINVSVILAEFGIESIPMGFLAGDAGKFIHESVVHRGLRPDFTWVSGETRTNIKIIESDGQLTEVNEPGPMVEAGQVDELIAKISSMLKAGDWLIASGSLPPGVPVGTYGRLAALAASRGAKALVDADGSALRLTIQSKPYMMKPNLYELERLVGKSLGEISQVLITAKELLAGGVSIVVVSMGARGALFVTRDVALHAESEPVDVRSTVGCGDTLAAATVAGLIEGIPMKELAERAVGAATAKAAKDGTQLPSMCEIEAFRAFVKSELID